MNIQVTIMLGSNEHAADLKGNATELAEAILAAVGGSDDDTADSCTVSIQDMGSAGGPAMPAPPVIDPVPVTVNSTYATNNSAPPGDKQVRINATAPADTTAVYIDNETTEGDDISTQLFTLATGDEVEIRGVNDATRFAKFALTTVPIQQSGYVELPVSFVDSAGTLINGPCTLTYPARS